MAGTLPQTLQPTLTLEMLSLLCLHRMLSYSAYIFFSFSVFSSLTSVIMPERCVAGFCSNTRKDGFSLFKFPNDEELRKVWTKQVQRTRVMWQPSASSVLCNAHFEDSCFDRQNELRQSLGFTVTRKLELLPGSIPTIFKKPGHKSPKKRKSRATEKRQHLEVSCSDQLM